MPVNKGYEVQIDDSDDDWHRTGVLYSFTKTLAQPKLQEWNTMEITLDGERTVVTVNGTKVTDYREGGPVPEKKQKSEPDRGKRAASGYIGVQNHDDKDVVYFKEISVEKTEVQRSKGPRPLSTRELGARNRRCLPYTKIIALFDRQREFLQSARCNPLQIPTPSSQTARPDAVSRRPAAHGLQGAF